MLGKTSRLEEGSTSSYIALSMSASSSQKYQSDVHALKNNRPSRVSNVSFCSFLTMHTRDKELMVDGGSMQDAYFFPSDSRVTMYSKSCPEQLCHQEANGSIVNKVNFPLRNPKCYAVMQRKYFDPHWSAETVNEAIERGDVVRASFHVNAYNRVEAYCTIDGVPIDVLISGAVAQNRAVEGDVVAVQLDPLPFWTRLKGSAGHFNESTPMNDCNVLPGDMDILGNNHKGKDKLDIESEDADSGSSLPLTGKEFHNLDRAFASEAVDAELRVEPISYCCGSNACHSSIIDLSSTVCSFDKSEPLNSVGKLCAMINSFPSKRPTGRVVAVIEKSPRRNTVVGFLGVKKWLSYREGHKKENKKNRNSISFSGWEYIQLIPTDPKFPKMTVSVISLPIGMKTRLEKGDPTVEMELVAARIDNWKEESTLPEAHVMYILGRGGEIESNIAAILFQYAIPGAEFSSESLSCLPKTPWEVPVEEIERRKDLRNLCIFTIDPFTAIDLDDALSVERVSVDIFRVGVHIADVSYFVLPDTSLDMEAQIRSTSVYLLQHKLPLLPSLLSENLGSLIPGVDRLAFSIFWDINLAGETVDRWIGRTVIRSCCKMSYEHAQDIINGLVDVESPNDFRNGCPELLGQFQWCDVIRSIKSLHEISKILKENRFKGGALHLESPKLVFLFDECGIPYDSMLCERKGSNFLVEEFMLLANRTVAEVISRAFPSCALLRRHPEPNSRKLRDFESFCRKRGLELDASSSGQLHHSLEKIREKLNNDPTLFDILISYASKPMQLAAYFCSGELKDRENEWSHYSLAVSLYTHFTSPLRRYPDIVVHRTLGAVIEAQDMYLKGQKTLLKSIKQEAVARNYFTNIYFDKNAIESKEGQEALLAAALKYGVPSTEVLSDVAAHCNERKVSSRNAEDAADKLYMWVLLKRKDAFLSEARVLGLGPKFMSIYIHKLAIERRIYYDEVEGLTVEWLEMTSALVIDLCTSKRSQNRGSPGKCRALEDVAWIISSCDLKPEWEAFGDVNYEGGATQEGVVSVPSKDSEPVISGGSEIGPAVFPLTVRLLSTIPVVLHAIGGDDEPLDIGARLYMSSYLK
ncbi:PREDICTED: DIS3-like exonuclease 2 isoform X2 [Nelumbo nucifera]|nr:PREDICTED: DIS3-like exonuclease 2 isoform X2 [Nelumbo nucifera]